MHLTPKQAGRKYIQNAIALQIQNNSLTWSCTFNFIKLHSFCAYNLLDLLGTLNRSRNIDTLLKNIKTFWFCFIIYFHCDFLNYSSILIQYQNKCHFYLKILTNYQQGAKDSSTILRRRRRRRKINIRRFYFRHQHRHLGYRTWFTVAAITLKPRPLASSKTMICYTNTYCLIPNIP